MIASLVANASLILAALSAGSTTWRSQASAAASGLPAARPAGGSSLTANVPGSSSYSDAMYVTLMPIATPSVSFWAAAVYAVQHATSPACGSASLSLSGIAE